MDALQIGRDDGSFSGLRTPIKSHGKTSGADTCFSAKVRAVLTVCRPKWSDWYKKCGFPKDLSFEDFAWVMVAAQRSVSLGTIITDAQLGEWVVQYGQALFDNMNGEGARDMRQNREKKRFVFEPLRSPQYRGPPLTFNTVTADILMYKTGSTVRKFAEQWDRAILAVYKYKAARNLTGGTTEWHDLFNHLGDVSALSVDGRR
jgi:hypothetical protein